MESQDFLKLGQLFLDGGAWKGEQLVLREWVKNSTRPHAHVGDTEYVKNTDYGYLWWLKPFESKGKTYPSWNMLGNGGNKVSIFPNLDMAVTITSTNFNNREAHQQTDKLLTDYILGSITK